MGPSVCAIFSFFCFDGQTCHVVMFYSNGRKRSVVMWQALGWSVTANQEKLVVKAPTGPTSDVDIFREAAEVMRRLDVGRLVRILYY